MIFPKRFMEDARKSCLLALVILSAITGRPEAAPTQGTVKEKFGAWSYRCDKQPGETTEQCALTQQINAEDRGNSTIGVIIMRPKG